MQDLGTMSREEQWEVFEKEKKLEIREIREKHPLSIGILGVIVGLVCFSVVIILLEALLHGFDFEAPTRAYRFVLDNKFFFGVLVIFWSASFVFWTIRLYHALKLERLFKIFLKQKGIFAVPVPKN